MCKLFYCAWICVPYLDHHPKELFACGARADVGGWVLVSVFLWMVLELGTWVVI